MPASYLPNLAWDISFAEVDAHVVFQFLELISSHWNVSLLCICFITTTKHPSWLVVTREPHPYSPGASLSAALAGCTSSVRACIDCTHGVAVSPRLCGSVAHTGCTPHRFQALPPASRAMATESTCVRPLCAGTHPEHNLQITPETQGATARPRRATRRRRQRHGSASGCRGPTERVRDRSRHLRVVWSRHIFQGRSHGWIYCEALGLASPAMVRTENHAESAGN